MLANLEMGALVFVREGITLAMTNSADADFTSGRVKLRVHADEPSRTGERWRARRHSPRRTTRPTEVVVNPATLRRMWIGVYGAVSTCRSIALLGGPTMIGST